jgi:hypothetical protein
LNEPIFLLLVFDINKALLRRSKSSLQLSYAYTMGYDMNIALGWYIVCISCLALKRFSLILRNSEAYRGGGGKYSLSASNLKPLQVLSHLGIVSDNEQKSKIYSLPIRTLGTHNYHQKNELQSKKKLSRATRRINTNESTPKNPKKPPPSPSTSQAPPHNHTISRAPPSHSPTTA